MKIQVSEVIVRFMERLGIKTIFGMPGAHILPVYDALFDSGIEAVLAKHEQGAAFMADGYARISNQVGACITTAGPGATNLVTGIANAYADKRPVLIITGETPTYIFGRGGLQESSGEGGSIEQQAIFQSITRYFKLLERSDYLPNVLNQVIKTLYADEPGPAMISIPFNVQKEMVDSSILDDISFPKIRKSLKAVTHLTTDADLEDFSKLFSASKHPVIVAGYGVILSGAQQSLAKLAERYNIPVTTSLKGKGAFDETHLLSLGSLGVTSSGHAYRYIRDHADMLIFLGAGFNERTSYLWNRDLLGHRSIVQIDHSHHQLEKVFKADLAINRDINQALQQIYLQLDKDATEARSLIDLPVYLKKLDDAARAERKTVFQPAFSLVENLFVKMAEQFPAGLTVFDDNVIFAQNFLKVSVENHYFPNTGVSSLGHAIPAAIGAAFYQSEAVFAVIGDGGFQMCCMEIMTAVNYNKPLTIVLFNNQTMGLIRKNQAQQYGQRYYNCDFINPDYKQLAESFGINYFQANDVQQLEQFFAHADVKNNINLLEMNIDKDAFPNYQSRR